MSEYVPNLKKRGWRNVRVDNYKGDSTATERWEYRQEDRSATVDFASIGSYWKWEARDGTRSMQGRAPTLSKAVHNVEVFFASDVDVSGFTFDDALDYLVTVESFQEIAWDRENWLGEHSICHVLNVVNDCRRALNELLGENLDVLLKRHGIDWWNICVRGRNRARKYIRAKGEFERDGRITTLPD